MSANHLKRIRQAAIGVEEASGELEVSVAQARQAGYSWTDIGDVLGISRQAAFKRFGKATDPATDDVTDLGAASHLGDIAEKFWNHVANDEEAEGMAMLSRAARKLLPWSEIMKTWTAIVTEMGSLESVDDGEVVPYKGRVRDSNKESTQPGIFSKAVGKVMGWTIYVHELNFEAGDIMGRIAFNRNDQIDGFLLLPTYATEYEF